MADSAEFRSLLEDADNLRLELKNQRDEIGERCRRLRRRRSWWQTVVVFATSLSTALAGYLAQASADERLRLVLAVVVALTGVVSAVRDAWRVNEALDDANERYSEIRTVTIDLERARREAEGSNREEDKLFKLGPAVRSARAKLDELSDELVTVQNSPEKKEKSV